MVTFRDKSIPTKVFNLIVARILIKISVVFIAILLNAGYTEILVLLAIIFVSEIYRNIGTLYIIKKNKNRMYVGAIISAIDGTLFVLALYYANALNTDLYLLILLSIILNTAEFGLLSSVVEGIVAGFSYAIFVLINVGYTDTAVFFSTYLVRIVSLTTLGWITGWLASELNDKESKLKLVLENDIHEEELNEMKNTFVSDAAETLRTPISAVKGYSDLILNGRAGEINDTIKGYLSNISTNIALIDSMVGELLHIIEIENDSIKLKKKQVNVKEFVDSVRENAEAFGRIYKANIDFEVEISNDELISVDEYRLKIAIKNLLYYIFELSGDRVEILFTRDIDNLCIKVKSQIKKLGELEVFTEDENVNTDKIYKANMLKVYTSKLIIESHEGRIEIKKDEDSIVSFNIFIPYNTSK